MYKKNQVLSIDSIVLLSLRQYNRLRASGKLKRSPNSLNFLLGPFPICGSLLLQVTFQKYSWVDSS